MYKSKKPLICLTAGGSGGHVMPAVALAQEIMKLGHPVLIITDQRAYHYWPHILHNFIEVLPTTNIRKSGIFYKITSLFLFLKSFFISLQILYKHNPSVVVGFGGYPTLMPLLASLITRKVIALFELDSRVGIVNQLFTRFTKVRLSAQNLSTPLFTCMGLPVRKSIDDLSAETYHPPISGGIFCLLIVGGSQGARIFSKIIPEALQLLPVAVRDCLEVSHQVHANDLETVKSTYKISGIHCKVQTFFSEMDKELLQAHLVISRSGASTLAELSLAKRPPILIPYPHAAENHQLRNAQPYVEHKAAWLIEEKDFTPYRLAELVLNLMENPNKLEYASSQMAKLAKTHAAEHTAKTIIKLTKELKCTPRRTK